MLDCKRPNESVQHRHSYPAPNCIFESPKTTQSSSSYSFLAP